jgi:hypothetical protein
MEKTTTTYEKEEADFRRKRQWTSFKAQVFTGLSTATFLGVIANIVGTMIAAVGPTSKALDAALALGDPATIAIMGAALAAGTVFTYMAQNEWTDMRILEDNHLAKRNAQCMQQSQAVEKGCAVEYEQNCRADGKQWTQAVQAKPELVVSR